MILWLRFKELWRLWPAFLLLAALQCVMGRTSAVALHERDVSVDVGYYAEKETALSRRFVEGLGARAGFRMVAIDPADSAELLGTGELQAVVALSKSFDASITDGERPALSLERAPGVTDASFLTAGLTSQWLILRTEALAGSYTDGAAPAPGDPPHNGEDRPPPVSFSYEGPLYQREPFFAPPAFGVPALFLLLAFLHAASFSVGGDSPRWRIRGRAALRKGAVAGVAAVFFFWGCSVALYVAGMRLIYHAVVPVPVVMALLGLAAYAAASGALLAYCGKRRLAAWVFIPCLLLNMTVGGGLWNAAGAGMLLPPLLPVSAVLASGPGAWGGVVTLWAQAAACILLVLVLTTRGQGVSKQNI